VSSSIATNTTINTANDLEFKVKALKDELIKKKQEAEKLRQSLKIKEKSKLKEKEEFLRKKDQFLRFAYRQDKSSSRQATAVFNLANTAPRNR
jgi:lipid A disaccharide synthetase